MANLRSPTAGLRRSRIAQPSPLSRSHPGPSPRRRWRPRRLSSPSCSYVNVLRVSKDDAIVRPAEAEGVRYGNAYSSGVREVADEIQVAFRVGLVEICVERKEPMVDRQGAYRGLDCPGRVGVAISNSFGFG